MTNNEPLIQGSESVVSERMKVLFDDPIIVSAARLERLLYIAETAADIGKRAVASEPPDYEHAKWTLTLSSDECHFLASAFEDLKPGDLDPIPS